MQVMLKDTPYSLASDGWTSRRNTSYTAITIHWIDSKWKLHSCALGCLPKESILSSGELHVQEVSNTMSCFGLSYKKFTASVTDTEAVMGVAGDNCESQAVIHGGATEWIGCVDHILELTTDIAMSDTEHSLSTMTACRRLVGYFQRSAKSNKALLDIQLAMNNNPINHRAVTCIQDVATRC